MSSETPTWDCCSVALSQAHFHTEHKGPGKWSRAKCYLETSQKDPTIIIMYVLLIWVCTISILLLETENSIVSNGWDSSADVNNLAKVFANWAHDCWSNLPRQTISKPIPAWEPIATYLLRVCCWSEASNEWDTRVAAGSAPTWAGAGADIVHII